MSIIFYNMENCGYCKETKKRLQKEIANGDVMMRPANEANGANGFPFFKSTVTGKTTSGLPDSIESLHMKLGHQENYSGCTKGCASDRRPNDVYEPPSDYQDWIGVL
jgi:glutaredoxin